jgi:hypothetical protein
MIRAAGGIARPESDRAGVGRTSKLKVLLRKAAGRIKKAFWSTFGELLDAFPAEECQNYLRECGYKFSSIEFALALIFQP